MFWLRGQTPQERFISTNALLPLCFDDHSPASGAAAYQQDPSIRLLLDFFAGKGLAALKQEDQQEAWYQDWIDYQARHGLYASILSPQRYSSRGHQLNLLRLTRFVESIAYCSPAHGYSMHVSFLGLFPILMSSNEALKKEAIAKLEAGGLFAFGVSEKAHGSDLLANEFTVTEVQSGGRQAHGSKYYIGNANEACIISVLGKRVGVNAAPSTRRAPLAFIALRPRETQAFTKFRKIRTLGIRTAFVGEFEVADHPVPERDVISEAREAWDAAFNTVNFGKFFLGFGAIGICEHAFAEAAAHLRNRVLYGKPVSTMPHIRFASTIAFARLLAMKLYANRALDYLQVAGDDDRRYLLFNAVQKARVSTEGVKVVELLSECIGARGFEAETYFETAFRDVPMIPGLEGSTHINNALTAQSIDNYFANSQSPVSSPASLALGQVTPSENAYWFAARDRNPKTVRFAPYLSAYASLGANLNVRIFCKQIEAFRRFSSGVSALNPTSDVHLLISIGKCFSVIAYAQLVTENCSLIEATPDIVSVIFHALIEDLTAEALKLIPLLPHASAGRKALRGVVKAPRTTATEMMGATKLAAQIFGQSTIAAGACG